MVVARFFAQRSKEKSDRRSNFKTVSACTPNQSEILGAGTPHPQELAKGLSFKSSLSGISAGWEREAKKGPFLFHRLKRDIG